MEVDKEMISKSIEASSQQIDADNLISGPIDVTIKSVQRGPSNEQPIQLVLEETTLFYRPNKTFRRVLVGAFGDDAKDWVGKRLRLARDADVVYAGVKVGGTVITHASISAPIVLMLSVKRGKKSAVKIDVIPAAKPTKKIDPAHTPEHKAVNVEKAKAAITQPHARGTISGDASEGDLSDMPRIPKADMDKMLAAFAKIGMDSAAVEAEYNKPIATWTLDDFTEAREVFKVCKQDWDLKQAAEKSTQTNEEVI